jgi:hypothetical protein
MLRQRGGEQRRRARVPHVLIGHDRECHGAGVRGHPDGRSISGVVRQDQALQRELRAPRLRLSLSTELAPLSAG